jgi:RNase P/RNase MRP subunit p29
MTYKIRKKSKEIPVEYWREQEIARLRKKNKGKAPPFLEVMRTTTRGMAGIQERVHKKNALVQYNERMARVKKVSKKGIWIEPFTEPTDKSLATPTGKIIFIPEKRVEKEVYPFGTSLPVYISPPFQLA